MTTDHGADYGAADLVGLLVQLRAALDATELPLEGTAADRARATRREMVDQLDDYVLPRLRQIDAPLLAVVGGSTGAGKSTLTNSLVGQRVSEPGVLRPTTRSPVLVHHPADADWFDQSRILPELARSTGAPADPGSLQMVATDRLAAGLAILDAPDIDSVERANRTLAAQLLAAADLWLFVTSAARYADQVPWDLLRTAAERSTAVAVVLDRTAPQSIEEVTAHLAQMLSDRGLGDSPLFTVPESTVGADGLLPAAAVEPVRRWLDSLASDASARQTVVRQTLDGAIRSLGHRTRAVADEAKSQGRVTVMLRADADSAYDEAVTAVDQASQDGTLLRGEVLARWQEFVGTGELLKSLEQRVGRLRDRVVAAFKGRPQSAQQVTVAVESGLETLLSEHADAAAERAVAAWRSTEAGRGVLEGADTDLSRASRDFRARTERTIRDWQRGVLDLVRAEGAHKRSKARYMAYGVNGLSVALMMVVFVYTAGLTGAEAGIAGGSAVLSQKLLEAVFGDQAVRRLVEQARADLTDRVDELFTVERARYHAVLDRTGVSVDQSRR
ncbi:MAG TPA: GTPase domain-containing protein, partial [Nocardioidaceae bacterium]|nr:GTPase domain-containing protein [Nocardioidaceae bacterium]